MCAQECEGRDDLGRKHKISKEKKARKGQRSRDISQAGAGGRSTVFAASLLPQAAFPSPSQPPTCGTAWAAPAAGIVPIWRVAPASGVTCGVTVGSGFSPRMFLSPSAARGDGSGFCGRAGSSSQTVFVAFQSICDTHKSWPATANQPLALKWFYLKLILFILLSASVSRANPKRNN